MENKNLLPFPYDFKELKPEQRSEISRIFKCTITMDTISVGPKSYKLLRPYVAEAANIYNMPLRSSDIFVVTFPRSGTTLVSELVWLIENNLDYEGAAATPIANRVTFLDMFTFLSQKWVEDFAMANKESEQSEHLKVLEKVAMPVTDSLSAAASPRFLKTHLPLSLLPPPLLDTARVLYVARDPRDVAVSFYHHSRLMKFVDYSGTFKEFWNMFVNDLMTMTPFFEHLKEAWEQRNNPNMLFLFYEELATDLPGTVRRVADFLGKELSAEELSRLCEHLQISNFKKNASVNYESWRAVNILDSTETFIRRGKAGGWHDYFDAEMALQAERWIEQNLRDTDLRFPSM